MSLRRQRLSEADSSRRPPAAPGNHDIVRIGETKRGPRPLVEEIGIEASGPEQCHLPIELLACTAHFGKLLVERVDLVFEGSAKR